MFQAVTAVAVLSDLSTTYALLLASPHRELNLVLQSLASTSPHLAMAAFVGFAAALLGVCFVGGPWVARVAGSYLLLALGFAGVNNVLAFTVGVSMLGQTPALAPFLIAYGFPTVGLFVGTAWHYRVERTLPWRRVFPISFGVGIAMVVLPLVLG